MKSPSNLDPISRTWATIWLSHIGVYETSSFHILRFSPVVACCIAHNDVPYFAANFLRLNFPVALSAFTFCFSAGLSRRMGGRPNRFPCFRAFCSPIRTLSTIKERSNSATAPRTVKTIFPVGVDVSTCSEMETKSIPTPRNVSKA